MICPECNAWVPDSVDGLIAEHECGSRPMFSLGGLWSYAKMVAYDPPVQVWKTKMDVPAPPGSELEAALKQDDFESVPERFQQDWMMKKTAEALDGKNSGHVIQAGTICDLTAYSMMVVAAGVDRVKGLNSGAPTQESDHVERCQTEVDCQDALTAWANHASPGIVQIKFQPGTGAHTFAVERVYPGHGEPYFRVYQSYQGTYRLSDSLGLTSSNSVHPNENKRDQTKRLGNFNEMTRTIGGGKLLSRTSFQEVIAQPISKTLNGGMSSAEYTSLTGGHSQQSQTCDRVLLLCCDIIDPGQFKAHYQSLRECLGMSAHWVEI